MDNKSLVSKVAVVVALVVVVGLAVYYFYGRGTLPGQAPGGAGATSTQPAVEKPPPNDLDRMTLQDAVQLALPKAREWKPGAVLSDVKSLEGGAGNTGRSNDWELYFTSTSTKTSGYRVIIKNKAIVKAEEVVFTGTTVKGAATKGGELPANIISSQEAVDRMHRIPGYENEPVLSIGLEYGPDGKVWGWNVKTSRGVVTIRATK